MQESEEKQETCPCASGEEKEELCLCASGEENREKQETCPCASGEAAETPAEKDANGEKAVCPCASGRKKERSGEERQKLINRLNRIEGQIRGIRGMVEADAYCTDVLVQVSAACSALNSFNKELLSTHIKGCVAEDIKNGKEESVDDLVRTIWKLMK